MSSSTKIAAVKKPRLKRRWLRFSLRTLLVLMFLAALPLAWVGHEVQRYRAEWAAMEQIQVLGGSVSGYEPIGPAWLRTALGTRFEDFFNTPISVSFAEMKLSDDEIEPLSQLRHLSSLSLVGCTLNDGAVAAIGDQRKLTWLLLRRATFNNSVLHRSLASLEKLEVVDLRNTSMDDAGLETFAHMRNLKSMHLRGSRVRGPGLVYFRDLQRLEEVCLTWTPAADDGLAHLATCPNLIGLEVGTGVTDTGMSDIGKLRQIEWLRLDDSQITDAGMKHLMGLSKLRYLQLNGTRITDEGLSNLDKLTMLTNVCLNRTKITSAGLVHLRDLTSLDHLEIAGTDVDDRAIPHLAACAGLRTVWLGNTRISPLGSQQLKAQQPRLSIYIADPGLTSPFP